MSESGAPEILVRRAEAEKDLDNIAGVNARVFMGNRDRLDVAERWVGDLFRMRDIYHYFVAEIDGKFAGYISWQLHGGFLRSEPVVELDQLGIHPDFQDHGLGRTLIEKTLEEMMEWILAVDDRIESHVSFVVWCYSDNWPAIGLYSKIFPDRAGHRTMHGIREETMFRLRRRVIRSMRKK